MRFRMVGLLGLALVSTGCSRGVRTREVHFYNLTPQSNSIRVDIIYPETLNQYSELRREFSEDPTRYFLHPMRNNLAHVTRDRIQPAAMGQVVRIEGSKPKGIWPRLRYEPYMVIIADFGQRQSNAPLGQGGVGIIMLSENDGAKKREHIEIHAGFMRLRQRR